MKCLNFIAASFLVATCQSCHTVTTYCPLQCDLFEDCMAFLVDTQNMCVSSWRSNKEEIIFRWRADSRIRNDGDEGMCSAVTLENMEVAYDKHDLNKTIKNITLSASGKHQGELHRFVRHINELKYKFERSKGETETPQGEPHLFLNPLNPDIGVAGGYDLITPSIRGKTELEKSSSDDSLYDSVEMPHKTPGDEAPDKPNHKSSDDSSESSAIYGSGPVETPGEEPSKPGPPPPPCKQCRNHKELFQNSLCKECYMYNKIQIMNRLGNMKCSDCKKTFPAVNKNQIYCRDCCQKPENVDLKKFKENELLD